MLSGSILEKLAIAHENTNRPLRFGVYYKNTLVALCHALEDGILTAKSKPLVIAAFQRGKWYLQEAERYKELALKSEFIIIMASPDTGFNEHPTSQLENVGLVGLENDDPVGQEWHLIIISPTYTAMVLCQEISDKDYGKEGLPKTDLERKFYGFWTFEPQLVEEAVKLAIEHIKKYDIELHNTLTEKLELIINNKTSEKDDLVKIVNRVVDYLQTTETGLNQQKDHLDINLISNELQAFVRLAQIMELANTGNAMATAEVSALAEVMGELLNLPGWQIKRLKLAGLLHGLVTLGVKSIADFEHNLSCPLDEKIQALRVMPKLQAIAHIINHQNEWWNGDGYPGGLRGEEIPLESRILGLLAHFEHLINQLSSENSLLSQEEILNQALNECQVQSGIRWDENIVDKLQLLVIGLQQGLVLPIKPPKIHPGMWIMDN